MLAPATCENIICEDPIDLFGTNHKVLGEDGTCPTKVIMGKLYDFRCYFCKILPRVGMANRSELYRHYSVMHYTAELKAEFGTKGKCPLCHKDQKQGSFVSHMGQVHDEVITMKQCSKLTLLCRWSGAQVFAREGEDPSEGAEGQRRSTQQARNRLCQKTIHQV